uniref:Uncharacterized protein n=1 Tax=viral metagenome TaxID=1070528 RepID=A0A6M3KYI6_9ZZZZ
MPIARQVGKLDEQVTYVQASDITLFANKQLIIDGMYEIADGYALEIEEDGILVIL